MKILGIESSCDETAAAIVEDGKTLLSNIVATSADIHAKTGGVIPEMAARKQIEYIIPVIVRALKNAKLTKKDIDKIAVTVGPGLIGSLLIGIETAKTLSLVWKKPIIPVNHLIGHIYANWLNKSSEPKFPALALVVSGGHTDLIIMKNHKDIEWLGGTRDDAAGEAFDKTARLLGLAYPGGPNLAKQADIYLTNLQNSRMSLFPRPIVSEKNFDWSFSGLKTAVLRKTQQKQLQKEEIPWIAAEVQEAIVDSLVIKSLRAIEKYRIKSFLLAGGVAANIRLREKFVNEIMTKGTKIDFHVPEAKYCTDNAAYIASAAYFAGKQKPWHKVTANPNLGITDLV